MKSILKVDELTYEIEILVFLTEVDFKSQAIKYGCTEHFDCADYVIAFSRSTLRTTLL